ncbi:hypothetical protein Tco_0139519 [Tanacetum coccineum]
MSDTSLIGIVKDTTDAKINSLLDIKIQSEVPHIQSPSLLTIHVSVISEPSILTSIPETASVAPTTTLLPPLSVSTIPPVVLQTTTPIPTPPITTDAPTITIVVPEFDALFAVQLRVVKLEKDVSELKKIDHSAKDLANLKSQVQTAIKKCIGSKIGDDLQKSASKIHNIKREQAKKQKKPKYIIKSTDKAALKEYDQKSTLYQTMHENKSFNRNPANHALYYALMKALIDDENVMDKGVADTVKNHKRQHDDDDDDDDDDPLARPNQGKKTKRRRTKESESSKKTSTTKETSTGKASTKGSKTGKYASAKKPVEEPIVEVVIDDTVYTAGKDVVRDDDQPQDTSEPKTYKTLNQYWFKQPPRPPTPDPEWNKHQVVLDQPEQPWFNQMVSATNDPLTFKDLMATPIDFSKYVLNRLKIENLTQYLLLGPVYNLLKGTCTSSIELEYNFQECFNKLTDKLDWNNPKGDCYPFDLSKPLPLQGHLGHLTVVVDYFFNNDMEYLKTSDPEKTYTTSITKTKVARYEIVGIEYMTPTLWSTIKHAYDKDAEKGIKHWGERRKLWYKSQMNKFSKHNVYSTQTILGVKSVSVKKLHGYGHLEEIVVKRTDQQLYKFKKLFHLNESDIVDFIVALRMFTKSLIIKRRVKDLQLGVESYPKKLNITAPQKTFPEIEFKELYTPLYKPPGVIYEDLDKQKRVMRVDKLYKFSDGTLKTVRDELHHGILDFRLGYNKEMSRRKWTVIDKKRSEIMVELIDKQMHERNH